MAPASPSCWACMPSRSSSRSNGPRRRRSSCRPPLWSSTWRRCQRHRRLQHRPRSLRRRRHRSKSCPCRSWPRRPSQRSRCPSRSSPSLSHNRQSRWRRSPSRPRRNLPRSHRAKRRRATHLRRSPHNLRRAHRHSSWPPRLPGKARCWRICRSTRSTRLAPNAVARKV